MIDEFLRPDRRTTFARNAWAAVALASVVACSAWAEARAATASGGVAEAASAPSPAVSNAMSNAEPVKPGLVRLAGAQAGTLLRFDATGLVAVAAEGLAIDPGALAAWRRIPGANHPPVDALVLTTIGPGRWPEVVRAAGAGVPVIAQRQAVERASEGTSTAVERVVTFENDYLLRAGAFEVEVEHVGRGRTGSDSVVLFRDLGVLAVGDLYTRGVPAPDCASGGSYAGWAAAIDHLLWFEFDQVVASRGAPVGRKELEVFRDKLSALAAGAASAPSGIGCASGRAASSRSDVPKPT